MPTSTAIGRVNETQPPENSSKTSFGDIQSSKPIGRIKYSTLEEPRTVQKLYTVTSIGRHQYDELIIQLPDSQEPFKNVIRRNPKVFTNWTYSPFSSLRVTNSSKTSCHDIPMSSPV